MDFASLAKTLAGIGLPMLAKIVGTAVGGPFGFIAASAITGIAGSLGLPPAASPADINAAIQADQAAAASKLQAMEQQAATQLAFSKGQLDLDKIEAASPSLFVAGWRPAFAWIVEFWLTVWLAIFTFDFLSGRIDLAQMLSIMQAPWALFAAMMGIRTVEKWGGVDTRVLARLRGGRSDAQ